MQCVTHDDSLAACLCHTSIPVLLDTHVIQASLYEVHEHDLTFVKHAPES